MARSISSSKVSVKITGSLINTITDSSSVSVTQPALNEIISLTSGVGPSQANRAWQRKDINLSNGSQETINVFDFVGMDIGAGDGKDALGQSMDLVEVVAIAVVNENAVGAGGALEILPAHSEGWPSIGTHTKATGGALYGQGILLKVNPSDVGFPVDTNANRITFRADDGQVSYSVYILGRDDTEESSSSSSSLSSSSESSNSSSTSTSRSGSSSSQSMSTSSSTSSSSSSSISTSSSSSMSDDSSSSISSTS